MKDFQLLIPNLQKTAKSIYRYIVKFDLHIRLFLLPVFLLCLLAILFILIVHVQLQIVALQLRTKPLFENMHDYPTVLDHFAPVISAATAVVMDADTNTVIFQKNPIIQSSMASTTKVMTALTALDYFQPTDTLTVKRDFVEGSGLHLSSGEQFTFEDLLYAMFLPSANDAAMTVADNYPGGEKAFVAAMNKKAYALHLYHTAYQDPAGLEDNGDYTTVIDLAHLGAIALQQPLIATIVRTKDKYITTIDEKNGYDLHNLNQLLGSDGVIGIKTGTTEGAGQVLITAKQDNTGRIYIIVVMDSSDRYTDTLSLLELTDAHITWLSPEQIVASVK